MENEILNFADGTLVHGDCTEVIESLPNQSVDLIFTSPPYCMGKDYDRYESIEDFSESIAALQERMIPKLKDGGSLCWQVGNHVSNVVLTPLDYLVYQTSKCIPELRLRNRVVWTFEHGAHAKKRLSGRYETVLWFSKGDSYRFHLDAIRVPQKYPGKRHYKGPNRGKLSGNPLGKNPGDVWSIPNVKANHVEKTEHPCQFPVALVCRFVRALAPKDGIVLDPFAGTSTTAIAALEAGRKFHCIELERRYLEISKQRILDWYAGRAKIRDDVPIMRPDPSTAVATRPAHFVARNQL